jgi:hypothetical protein
LTLTLPRANSLEQLIADVCHASTSRRPITAGQCALEFSSFLRSAFLQFIFHLTIKVITREKVGGPLIAQTPSLHYSRIPQVFLKSP